MGESGVPGDTDVLSIRPGGQEVSEEKIIPKSEIAPPETTSVDPMKAILAELETHPVTVEEPVQPKEEVRLETSERPTMPSLEEPDDKGIRHLRGVSVKMPSKK